MAHLIAEVRENGRQRDAIADALLHDIADGGSLALERKDGMTAIVGPDVSKAGSFRVTRLDGAEPIGHTEASNMRDALRQALLEGFVPSEGIPRANEMRSIDGGSVTKVDDLRERMSAVVREAQAYGKYGSSRAREPISVLGRTGALQLVEANHAEWTEQTPTYLATDLPVSEGVGNQNGAVFAFWIGDRDPSSPAVTQAMTDFVSDHDVVGVRFIRALPAKVHASIMAEWEAVSAMSAGQQKRQLYKDDRGHLVDVKTMGLETVEFSNQGGGFLRTMRRADFEKRFVQTDTPPFEPVTIVAEWLDDDARLPAYSNGLLWNGWEMPYFEKDTAMRLMGMMPGIRFDEARDAFVARDENVDEDDIYGKVSILVDDKTVDTYAIGAGSWCWETPEEEPDVTPTYRMRN